MNDRELIDGLTGWADELKTPHLRDMLREAAARLDALRWRSVEEGLPDIGVKVIAEWSGSIGVRTAQRTHDGKWLVAYVGWLADPVRWRYATPPGAEGGGA